MIMRFWQKMHWDEDEQRYFTDNPKEVCGVCNVDSSVSREQLLLLERHQHQ